MGMVIPRRDRGARAEGRLLDVAERLLLEHGAAQLSSRKVTAEAGMSIGMVNYYFGSRSDLLAAVLWRRIGELEQARLTRLRSLPVPLSLDGLVMAFVEETLDYRWDGGGVVELLTAAQGDPVAVMEAMRVGILGGEGKTAAWVLEALSTLLPGVSVAGMQWVWRLATAAMGEAIKVWEPSGENAAELVQRLTALFIPMLTLGGLKLCGQPSRAGKRFDALVYREQLQGCNEIKM